MSVVAESVERKYALMKLGAGDWLLPGNDGETIFRLASYVDGQSMGLDSPDRTYWSVYRWPGTREQLRAHLSDWDALYDWDAWDHVAQLLPTRAEAIREALRS